MWYRLREAVEFNYMSLYMKVCALWRNAGRMNDVGFEQSTFLHTLTILNTGFAIEMDWIFITVNFSNTKYSEGETIPPPYFFV